MKLLDELKAIGYKVTLKGDKIRATYILPGNPPVDRIKPLLDELRNHKEDIISHLRFKDEFNRLAEHLRQRNYIPENFAKLQRLTLEMNRAWETLNYSTFKKTIAEMMAIPGILRPEGGTPQAVRIFSKVLGEAVWVVTYPEAVALVPEGGVYYLPEEIRNLWGASPEDIRSVHKIKKELGGRLIAVNKVEEGTA